MNASAYSEDQMLQAGTAEFFEEHLGWTTEFAFDREDYGPASLLGRSHRGEVVLVRELRKALHRLNPKAPIQIEPAKDAKEEPAKASLTERDLYPLLCRYLHAEFGLYPQRIDEKRSSNRNGPKGNIWLFPDIVALEDLGAEWHKDIRDCVRHYGDPRCRLWSFEVKLKLNRSNVREAWFQTVSNSSWANQGYLVAAEVEGADTMKELRLLAAAHGMGLIVLDVEDPTEGSEIRIPARERSDVDWDACNRLAEENADFRDYIRAVRQFHQTDDIKRGDWDLPANVG